MRIAVITAVLSGNRDALTRCLASVAAQTIPRTHILVGKTLPEFLAREDGVQRLQLETCGSAFGNVERAFGTVSAIAQEFDAIAYLDEDCWLEKRHLEIMTEVAEQNSASVCSSGRNLYGDNGAFLGVCPEVDGENFVDANCLFFLRTAFGATAQWYLTPPGQQRIADRYLWKAIRDLRLVRAHHGIPTVNYTTRYRVHYDFFSKPVPSEKELIVSEEAPIRSEDLHGATGRERARGDVLEVNRRAAQRVSVCMIVRDEEDNIRDCIGCVPGNVHEIVVVDTGSRDRTRELAREAGANVLDFEWIQNFSAARNFAADRASGDWIFWLDADDRLDSENQNRLQSLIDRLTEGNRGYLMTQASKFDANTGDSLHVDHVRLFRNHPRARWSYRLHEQIVPALQELNYEIAKTKIVINHLGYADAKICKSKMERNRRILELERSERPDDGFVLFNLAGIALDSGALDEGISLLHQSIERTHPRASFLPKATILLIRALCRKGDLVSANTEIAKAREKFPDHAEIVFEEGALKLRHRDLQCARACFEKVVQSPPSTYWVGMDPLIFTLHARHNLALVYRDLKMIAEAEREWKQAAVENPLAGAPWLGLLELALFQKDVAKAESIIREFPGADSAPAVASVLRARMAIHCKDNATALHEADKTRKNHPNDQWSSQFFRAMRSRLGL